MFKQNMIQARNILLTLGFVFLFFGTSFSMEENLFHKAPIDTSQAYVKLIRRSNGKPVMLSVGKTVSIWARDMKFRGKITKITYDKIYINHAPFQISEIYHIKVKNTLYSILGVSMEIYGGIISFAGVLIMTMPGFEFTGFIVIVEGVAFVWWGNTMFKGRNFKQKNWKYEPSEINSDMNFISD